MSLNADLIKINNLQIAAKIISDQMLVGLHKSKRTGIGVEFDQYRHYEPGDDPKRIDWKLFARTQKHQIKESSTESPIIINFIIDLSGSMNYEENKVSRLAYAKVLLASLAYLGFRQNDFMNLYSLKNGHLELLAPQGKQVFQKILYALENAKAEGSLNLENFKFPQFQTKSKELIVLISDFLEINNGFFELVTQWAKPGKEILIYQLLGKQETEFDFKGNYLFKDLETGQEIDLSPEIIKNRYVLKLEKYLLETEEKLNLPHVHYLKYSMDQPIAEVLKNSLKKVKWNL